MREVILFKTCKGLNDSTAISTQTSNPVQGRPEAGETELISCVNMTVTADGAIEKVPALSTVFTHTAPVTRMSAGSRLFFGDGLDTYELSGSVATKRFPVLDGPIMHTPLDVRVSGATKVYKSVNPAGAMSEAVVGTNPDTAESVAYAKQPLFDGGFVYGARAYGIKGKFLQYSKPYHYDLWNLGDGFIGHQFTCLQGGAIPGCILTAHAEGVSVYVGGDPLDPQTTKKFYPCSYAANTLYSGFISKALGHGHVLLCADGVYMVDQDGGISRVTGNRLGRANTLNSSYVGAVLTGGKYMAFGNSVCVEFDFTVKCAMLRASGVAAACVLADEAYVGVGSTIATISDSHDATSLCAFALPYSHLGAEGRKSFDSLYFTGSLVGDLAVTVRDQGNPEEPDRWTVFTSGLGAVQNMRIKLPKHTVGSKVSFHFSTTGKLRVEEIRATFGAGQRR